MQYPANRKGPDRSAAMVQYRRRAAHYDRELALFEPIRERAIELLVLRRGDTVLDVGCGTGLSFRGLRDRLGDGGRIVGIEQCPEMMERAHARIGRAGWKNVDLLCAPAASAHIAARADAALFHFTHDILREDAALHNVLSRLKPGARVVASGLQWAPPWMWPANGFVLAAALYSVTSLEGLARPWDKLATHLRDLAVQDSLGGAIFIASGSFAPHRQ